MDYDVIVIGEVLLEISTEEALRHGTPARLGFSGDALNQAAAASAAGARVGLLTRVGDDAIGEALLARLTVLGVDRGLVSLAPGHNGAYLTEADPAGHRAFSYLRAGSAASRIGPGDLDRAEVRRATYLLCSGITTTLSPSTTEAVVAARRLARNFVYDPNHRPTLADPTTAAATLRRLAPGSIITPSYPAETSALLGADSPGEAADRLLGWGARAAVVTCGPDGAWLAGDGPPAHLPAIPARTVTDQTGAGDVFTGTLTARLALGDPLPEAADLALAAASLSVEGRGGTGRIPSLAESRGHLDGHRAPLG
jgi:2-dehydro-3-deoxygluconokinase